MWYSCSVMRPLVMMLVAVALSSCRGAERTKDTPAKDDVSAQIQRFEQRAVERDSARVCERPIEVFAGSITVDRSDYQQTVARGESFVDEPIADLDRVLTKSTRVRFTLDYPFERPYTGVVSGEITLRRTIDGIREAVRKMYEGATQRDLPEVENKEVTGRYGRAFHVIDDLVIEQIQLCADDTFSIYIGS